MMEKATSGSCGGRDQRKDKVEQAQLATEEERGEEEEATLNK